MWDDESSSKLYSMMGGGGSHYVPTNVKSKSVPLLLPLIDTLRLKLMMIVVFH